MRGHAQNARTPLDEGAGGRRLEGITQEMPIMTAIIRQGFALDRADLARAKLAAASAHQSLNAWVRDAIRAHLAPAASTPQAPAADPADTARLAALIDRFGEHVAGGEQVVSDLKRAGMGLTRIADRLAPAAPRA
jgi:hypothetical protein